MVGIYKITNPKGKVYVGQSINLKERIRNYSLMRGNVKNQPKIYRSLKKYGWEQHIFEIIEECSIEQLDEKEVYWSLHYNVLGKKGLNLKIGNGKGKISEETKKKIGLANSKPKPKGFGEKIGNILRGRKVEVTWGDKISTSLLGKLKSQSHKENISKGKKGSRMTEESKLKIKNSPHRRENISISKSTSVLCIENNKIYRNIRYASEDLNISHSLIRMSCIKGIKAKGNTFKYI